ncbi:MAG: hypothetical protein ACYC0H_24160 [Solirubrobacteraceae bacterium]
MSVKAGERNITGVPLRGRGMMSGRGGIGPRLDRRDPAGPRAMAVGKQGVVERDSQADMMVCRDDQIMGPHGPAYD